MRDAGNGTPPMGRGRKVEQTSTGAVYSGFHEAVRECWRFWWE